MTEQTVGSRVQFRDGRWLGYGDSGDPSGAPILLCHGFPGSRRDADLLPETVVQELGVRMIAPDRPGMGLSGFVPRRALLDWPDDVVELADALSLKRFAVLGISGGGPYALACARRIPDRLTAVGVVSGMGPSDAPGAKQGTSWTFPGLHPLLRQIMLWLTSLGVRKKPDDFTNKMKTSFTGPDGELLRDHPDLIEVMVDSWREAFRSGTRGVLQEAVILKRPWGFALQDIAMTVHLWYGAKDGNVVPSVGKYLADSMPACQAELLEEEGHLSLVHNHAREILRTMLAHG